MAAAVRTFREACKNFTKLNCAQEYRWLIHSQNKFTLLMTNQDCIARRNFSTSRCVFLKKIRQRKEGDTTVIEGINYDSPRKGKVIEVENCNSACPLCRLGEGFNVQYTDVLILSQFLRPDGCLLPRRVTGLCTEQHRRVKNCVAKAQRASLMPQYRPDYKNGQPRTNPRSNWNHKKYNTYHDFED